MKFILVVLAIHFIVDIIAKNLKKEKTMNAEEVTERKFHPAENNIR